MQAHPTKIINSPFFRQKLVKYVQYSSYFCLKHAPFLISVECTCINQSFLQKFKGLKKQNLRDNMTNLELVLNMLAEVSTTEISKKKKPQGLEQNKTIANKGGTVAKKARKEIEAQTGQSIVSKDNPQTIKKLKSRNNNGIT